MQTLLRGISLGLLLAAFVSPAEARFAPAFQSGLASVYGPRDSGGQSGPTGQPINHAALAAAHRTLPLGTLVEVVNRQSGRAVVLRITDRGPYVPGRIIDLTPKSADALGVDGLGPVRLAVVSEAEGCTFAERFDAALMIRAQYGRAGCPAGNGEISKAEDHTAFNVAAPERRRHRHRRRHRR